MKKKTTEQLLQEISNKLDYIIEDDTIKSKINKLERRKINQLERQIDELDRKLLYLL